MTNLDQARGHSRGEAQAISIVAVGDLMLGDSPTCVGIGFRSHWFGRNVGAAFGGLREILEGADIVFGNLEAVLSEASEHSSRLQRDQMRADPQFAQHLREASFDVLNVANNHADQHGSRAFHDTVSALEQAGIRACGIKGDQLWSSQPAVLEARGIRVGFLGYSLRPKQYFRYENACYALGQREAIVEDVRRLATQVPIVVVSLHWGEEFVGSPSESERHLALELIGAGARLIIGHHPHVLRPVEEVSGGVIAYSLGNFVSDMRWLPGLRRSAVLRCRISPSDCRVSEVRPCWIGDDFFPRSSHGQGPISADTPVSVLGEEDYARYTSEALKRQRRALYLFTLRNLPRYQGPVLAELLRTFLGNKAATILPQSMRR